MLLWLVTVAFLVMSSRTTRGGLTPVQERVLEADTRRLSFLPFVFPKRPWVTTWDKDVRRPFDPANLKRTFHAKTGIALIMGPPSRGIEMLEIEGRYRDHLPKLLAALETAGLGPLFEKIRNGYEELTPSGGVHWLWRCDNPAPCEPLIRRPGPTATPVMLAELKAYGGLCITAPSPAVIHPDYDRGWEQTRGGISTIQKITAAEREAILEVFRSLDEMPEEVRREPVQKRAPRSGDDVRPGDDFNRRASWGSHVLEPAGWRWLRDRSGTGYWMRPGKEGRATSATTNHLGTDTFIAFSTSTPFDAGVYGGRKPSYSKFSAYATLNYGGDFSAAAKALYNEGYGTRHDRKSKELLVVPPIVEGIRLGTSPRRFRYIKAAFTNEVARVAASPTHERESQLTGAARRLGRFIEVDTDLIRTVLSRAAAQAGASQDQAAPAIEVGLSHVRRLAA